MNELPTRLRAMTEQALLAIKDDTERQNLRTVADAVSSLTWERWQAQRTPEDNRPEHEWVVLADVLAIAEDEGLSLSEKRIAIAFAFTHDTHYIARITEKQIRQVREAAALLEGADPTRAAELHNHARDLETAKDRQRREHMEGGARNARLVLPALEKDGHKLLIAEEVERCALVIAGHDLWKLGVPHPSGRDRLAVVCLEADALWPMTPLGVFADLERPDDAGHARRLAEPGAWHAQARNNVRTLIEYRKNWDGHADETFADRESIFRTREGFRRFKEWRAFWGV
jgi:hypothetical protein